MPPIKKEVNGWRLTHNEPGNYEYEKRVGNQVFSLHITKYDPAQFGGSGESYWEMGAAGGSDAERYGGSTNAEETFEKARDKAYCFMRHFSTSNMTTEGYNDVVEAGNACNWGRY